MFDQGPLYFEEKSIASQIFNGLTCAALGLGGAMAVTLFMAGPRLTAGAPASRRLSRDIAQLQNLEPVADAAQAAPECIIP